jgi:hypothetical protein
MNNYKTTLLLSSADLPVTSFRSKVQSFKVVVCSVAAILLLSAIDSTQAQSVDVDPATGRAQVSIPLYTLNFGRISVPINLSHSSTSVGVEEPEGDAGFGWNLTCNYGVYRQVRGLPDDLNPGYNNAGASGWLYGSSASAVNSFSVGSDDDFTSTYTDESNDFNTINGFGYTADTEPDLYTVVGPNLYFQFVFDASGVPRLLNYEDVKVTILSSAAGFTVKNNLGISYTFDNAEIATRQSVPFAGATITIFQTEYNYYHATSVQFAHMWHLTSVTDAIGNAVNFSYGNQLPTQSKSHKIKIGVGNTRDTLYYTSDYYTPQSLNSITAGNYSVDFTWSSIGLSMINISESGLSDALRYSFLYQQARSTTNTTIPIYVHNFLSKIIPSCSAQVPYKFTYQGVKDSTAIVKVDAAWRKLYSQDMWGQYNGAGGSDASQDVPQVYYYSGLADSRRLSLQQIPNNTATSTLTGANRFVNASKVGIGSLTQITYPSGGYTKIVWERNKYLDTLSGQVLFGPGLRVASLITDGGEAAFGRNATATNVYHQIVKNYTYTRSETDTTTSGLALYPPEYALSTGNGFVRTVHDLSPGSYVAYRRVKESTTQGSQVYIYSQPGMYPSTSYSTDWTATKSKIARNPATHYSIYNVQNGYYTFPFAPNPNYGFAQGVLTSVSEYSTNGGLVRQKKFVYSRISPNLQSVYGLRFEYQGASECDCFHFSKYQVITGTTNVLTQQITTEVSESNSSQLETVTTVYHYNSDVTNNNFLMDSIRTIWGDGSISRKKITYVKDFAALTNPTSGDLMANAIPAMITANRHGEVVEQYTSLKPIGGTETITGASIQLFQVLSGKVYPYQSLSLPVGTSFTPAAIASGSTQGFSKSSNYVLSTSFNDFDATGNPISISDNKQNKIASHYALNYSMGPVASFSNATATQTVYDGFEFATGRNLTPTTTLSYYSPAWTGQRAAILASSNTLTHTNLSNAGVPYRISCYVNAAQNSSVTFTFINPSNSSTVATTTLSYTSTNQWIYLEGLLNVTSGTPSVLKLQITSNATINIDDILVLPQSATVSTQTYLPLKGPTSQTDDRGNSTTVVYDALGRKTYAYDRQRNMIESTQYMMKGTVVNFINSQFTYTNAIAGSSFTATLPTSANCFSGISYQWNWDNTNVGTNSQNYTRTESNPGIHKLKLTVTNTDTQQSQSSEQNVTVWVVNSAPSFSFTNLPENNTVCSGDGYFNYTISTPSDGCGGASRATTIAWYVSTNGGTTYSQISGSGTSKLYHGTVGFLIKAVATQTCGTGEGATTTSTSVVQSITVNQCN